VAGEVDAAATGFPDSEISPAEAEDKGSPDIVNLDKYLI
jgi:hypothetical protein